MRRRRRYSIAKVAVESYGTLGGWSNREGGEETEVADDETENQHVEKLPMLGSVPIPGSIRLRPLGIRAPSRLSKASGSMVRCIGIRSVARLKSLG